MEYALQVNDLSKVFGQQRALQQVSFNVKKGRSLVSWAQVDLGKQRLSRSLQVSFCKLLEMLLFWASRQLK